MTRHYCFLCDRPVGASRCEACGGEAVPLEPGTPDTVPEPVYQIGPFPGAPRPARLRWDFAAGLIVAAVVALAALRLPSATEETPAEDVGGRETAQPTTTWTFQPALRPLWVLPPGSWIGLISGGAATTPPAVQTLAGRPLESTVPAGLVDVLADGAFLGKDDLGMYSVWTAGDRWDLDVASSVALAPNGSLLALVDSAGELHIWDLAHRRLLTTHPLPTSPRALHWSPDSDLVGVSLRGGGYGVWQIRGADPVASGAGSLLAVSPDRTALWADGRLELREFRGRLVRSWEEPTALDDLAAAFDPTGQYLALHGSGNDGTPGVWLLEVFGTGTTRLGGAGPFAFTGDGSALLHFEGGSLRSMPLEVGLRPGPVLEAVRPEAYVGARDRLRIYDPALLPSGTLWFLDGFRLSGTELAGSAVGPLPPSSEHDPEFAALTRTALPGDDTPILVLRWADQRATEFAGGSILIEGPGASLMLSGSSLSSFGGYPLYTDGESVKAIVSSAVERVLDPQALSEDRVLAVAGVGHTLLVLTETGGRATLHAMPAWSPELTGPGGVPRSDNSSALVVATVDPPVVAGRLLVSPDESTISLATTDSDGFTTTRIIWVGQRRAPCWPTYNGVCLLNVVQGVPIDFSPDGHWLLVRDPEGQSVGVSTRGRGVIELPAVFGTIAAWTVP